MSDLLESIHKFVVCGLLGGLAVGISMATVSAHSGATGVVKERMELMKDSGQQMKIIGKMVKGAVSYDAKAASQAALAISQHAAKTLDLFPENSNQHPSEALETIWEKREEFDKIAGTMEEDAKKLADLASKASSGAEIEGQFFNVAKTCKSCHEQFRLKKQD